MKISFTATKVLSSFLGIKCIERNVYLSCFSCFSSCIHGCRLLGKFIPHFGESILYLGKDLNLDGFSEQPGGDKKVFKSNNILISWRKNKNLLHLEVAEAGKITQLLCSKMCQSFAEGVAINDSVNEVVVVNDSVNSCETDQDTSQSRVCKSNATCSNIEELKTRQTTNTEAIQTLSDSLDHITTE